METLLRIHEILSALCKEKGMYGIYVYASANLTPNIEQVEQELVETSKAIPWLSVKQIQDLFTYGNLRGYYFFDTREEALAAFYSTAGDNGSASYNGPATVYALLSDNQGHILYEN